MLSWTSPGHGWGILAGLVLLGVIGLRADDHLPTITREQVAAYRAAHEAEWRAKTPAGEPRIFFLPAERTQRLAAVRHATGKLAEYRELLRGAADQIVAQPIPPYTPPEARVSATMNLRSAREEGWQRGFGDRLVTLAVAAAVFDTPAYRNHLKAMTLAACRFESWGRYGANGELPDSDLAAGHVVKGIAMAYDWHRTVFSDEERRFVRETLRRRVAHLMDGLYGQLFWSNWYSQNHNHICAAALGFAGAALFDEIPEAGDWLAGALLDFTYAGQCLAADGSSYEGLSYWSYGRSFIVEFIEGTRPITDAARLYAVPGLRNAIAHRVASSVPGFNGVLMWSDSRGSDVVGPHHLLYRLASEYRDGQGQFLADHLPFPPQGVGGDAIACTVLWYDASVVPAPPRELDYHASVWDVATSRSGWGERDYVLAVKAGINSNHHTHLDAGALALNVAGGWALLAPGYGLGLGRDGFFDNAGKRWTFFSNAAESHSTLLINGRNQRFDAQGGGTLEHLISAVGAWWAEVDLTHAYLDVTQVRRRILHQRGDYILVLDDVRATAPVTTEWLAQMPPETTIEGAELRLEALGAGLRIRSLDGTVFQRREPTSPIRDVPPDRLATFATKSTDARTALATLLQPTLSATVPALRTTLERDSAATRISVRSETWTDFVWLGDGASVTAVEGGASVVAETVVMRMQSTGLREVIARGLAKLTLDSGVLTANSPCDLALEATPDGAWRLTLATVFQGRIAPATGWALVTLDPGSEPLPLDGEINLAAGCYALVRAGKAVPARDETFENPFSSAPREPVTAADHAAASLPPASGRLDWEAETAPIERFGKTQSEPIGTASGGRALLGFGSASRWQTISWRVRVPVAGAYYLKVRYAMGEPVSWITLLADADGSNRQVWRIALNGPRGLSPERGWSVESRGWRESFAGGRDGHPVPISLTAGEHTITLESPSEALNLDALSLVGIANTR